MTSQAYVNSVSEQHNLYPGGNQALVFYMKCVTLVRQAVDTQNWRRKEWLSQHARAHWQGQL